jgi:ABC-2 type transport system ATP-binding protein
VPVALSVIDVTKHYRSRAALDGVSLQVAPGEVLALIGPNGAGKSTLISIVAGLRRPDSGQVTVAGVDVVAAPKAARRHVGLAPQDTALYEVLTVRENLTFFAELAGLDRRARAARIDELAAALRLAPLLERAAFRLSGGERRRLHTAIAFMHRPPLLLLDEATVGADIETRAALLNVVRAAAHDGAAVLYSTHYLPEVEALDATVGMLVAGRIIASGELDALIAQHGRCAVELTFSRAPRRVELGDLVAHVDGAVVRVEAADPARAVPLLISRLGALASDLLGVEVLRPSLDSVFLALTGRRYDSDTSDLDAA